MPALLLRKWSYTPDLRKECVSARHLGTCGRAPSFSCVDTGTSADKRPQGDEGVSGSVYQVRLLPGQVRRLPPRELYPDEAGASVVYLFHSVCSANRDPLVIENTRSGYCSAVSFWIIDSTIDFCESHPPLTHTSNLDKHIPMTSENPAFFSCPT